LPQSVEASQEIQLHTELGKCFSFFTDLVNIGACIPGCEQVLPHNPSSATFKVRIKVGYISKSLELRARFTDIRPMEHVSFTAEGSDAEITGRVDFAAKESGVTVRYAIEIRPLSVTGRTAISMVGKDLVAKQASEFATCIRQKLES
jgi:carbon monoxide dehydrogenase subunit G